MVGGSIPPGSFFSLYTFTLSIQHFMFSVYYADEEHDNLFTETNSVFEATCDYYQLLPDLEDCEWAMIKNEKEDVIIHSDLV